MQNHTLWYKWVSRCLHRSFKINITWHFWKMIDRIKNIPQFTSDTSGSADGFSECHWSIYGQNLIGVLLAISEPAAQRLIAMPSFAYFDWTRTFSCAVKQKSLTFHIEHELYQPYKNISTVNWTCVLTDSYSPGLFLFITSITVQVNKQCILGNRIISCFRRTDIPTLISMRTIVVIDALL